MIKRTLLALFGTLFMLCGCVNPDDVLSNPVLLGEQTLIQSDVVIGAALPLTGKYSAQGMEMLRGIETAVDVLNARRGIAGRRVRLETADTNGTPDGAEKAMSSLAAKKASIVVGGYSTTETDGLMALCWKASSRIMRSAFGISLCLHFLAFFEVWRSSGLHRKLHPCLLDLSTATVTRGNFLFI